MSLFCHVSADFGILHDVLRHLIQTPDVKQNTNDSPGYAQTRFEIKKTGCRWGIIGKPLSFHSLQGSMRTLTAYADLDPRNIPHPSVTSLHILDFGWVGALEVWSLASVLCHYVMSLQLFHLSWFTHTRYRTRTYQHRCSEILPC